MKNFCIILGITAMLFGFVLTAAGETSSSDDRSFTYVVTASRVEEDILSTPAHVTVITAEEIAESGETSVVRLLDKVAGVSFRSYSGDAQAQVSMRGFGEGAHGRVLVLVDGRRMNNPDMQGINWLSISLADIERIEVLRGSSSVLYGNHAVGGVINIITKKPSRAFELSASASVGSYWENRERVSVSLGGEKAGLSASVEHYSTEGYRDRSAYRSINAGVKGDLEISETLQADLGLRYSYIFYEMPGGLTQTEFEADPTQAMKSVYDEFFIETREPNLEDEARDHVITADFGLTWFAGDALMVEMPMSYEYKNIGLDMASWGSYTDRLVHTIGVRPQGVYETAAGSMPVRITGGADTYYALLDVTDFSEKERETKTNEFSIRQLSAGPYISGLFNITDAFSVELGGRYDYSRISAVNSDKSVDDYKDHNAFVYNSGIVFRPSDTMKVYAKYGTLFRYPYTDEQASLYGFGTDTLYQDIEAESGFTFEGGITMSLLRKANLDLSGYYVQLKDEIAYNNDTWRNENLDKTRRIGGDLELVLSPVDMIELRTGYSYVHATFIEGVNEGKRIPLVSDHSVDAGLEVKLPVGLSFGPSFTYKSPAYQGGDNANSGTMIDSYYLVGFSARFVPSGLPGYLVITAEGDNLLDSSYVPYIYWGAYYPALGRNFKVGVSYAY